MYRILNVIYIAVIGAFSTNPDPGHHRMRQQPPGQGGQYKHQGGRPDSG